MVRKMIRRDWIKKESYRCKKGEHILVDEEGVVWVVSNL